MHRVLRYCLLLTRFYERQEDNTNTYLHLYLFPLLMCHFFDKFQYKLPMYLLLKILRFAIVDSDISDGLVDFHQPPPFTKTAELLH